MKALKKMTALVLVGAFFIIGSVSSLASSTQTEVSRDDNFVTDEMVLEDREEAIACVRAKP